MPIDTCVIYRKSFDRSRWRKGIDEKRKMNVDVSIFANQCRQYTSGRADDLQLAGKSDSLEITTCGIGRTLFSFESLGDVIPIKVHFEDGGCLTRQTESTEWVFVKDGVKMPWHDEVFVRDREAIISAGAVADLFKLDGSHIRYLDDKIVMVVTMCGDVFEIEYVDKVIKEVRLNGEPYIRWKNNQWRLAGAKKPVYGVLEVSVHGLIFDARETHGYFDKYLTNGNLTTMRDGRCKFTFGVARF